MNVFRLRETQKIKKLQRHDAHAYDNPNKCKNNTNAKRL